jgi:hypothetical protein
MISGERLELIIRKQDDSERVLPIAQSDQRHG